MKILTGGLQVLLVVFSVYVHGAVFAAPTADPVFARLEEVLRDKQRYVREKEERIGKIKKNHDSSLYGQYYLNENLYKQYQKFKLDSAIYYVKRNLGIAGMLGNKDLRNSAHLQLAALYASTGRYRESEGILRNVNKQLLSDSLLVSYYSASIQFFEHYVTNSYSPSYINEIRSLRDSLLSVLPPASVEYQINLAQKNIYEGRIEVAEKDLVKMLSKVPFNGPSYAMVAYLLGNIYRGQQKMPLAKKFYSLSAIADITNAVKDHASMQNLALICYQEGDIDRAYRFTRSAVEDAIFCNVQFRTLHMSELYTIINTAYQDKEARSKEQLQVYLSLISVLTVFLLVAVVYVYRQMRRVSRIKEELSMVNQKLVALNQEISKTNAQLQERNVQLNDSNLIKEAYIAQFFDLCSTYINKLESFRKTLNKKATQKQLDELFKMLRSNTLINDEVEELYRIFDTIFLCLYPNFVSEFNALLVPEEVVKLKPGELLNTELRIYALIRLGITDSVRIASFLRYSLSTIYNYRTKMRNKAAVSRDLFESIVMRIGEVAEKT